MKKNLSGVLAIFGLFVLGSILAYYAVPTAIVLLGHTCAGFYKTFFWWQLVVSLIYSGYLAYNHAPNKEIDNDEGKSGN